MRFFLSLISAFVLHNGVVVWAGTPDKDTAKTVEQDQGYVVSGVVLDVSGEPLIGVTIQQKGTENKALTDMNGRYSLRLKPESSKTLILTYVGMKTKTLVATGATMNITMEEDAHALQDVVVVGAYGTAQKRSDLVGSAYQVNAEQLKGLPKQRLDVILEGLIPGVKIDPNTTDPGSPRTRFNVRVRGESSLNASNEPLWVIDGTPLYTGDKTNMMPGTSYSISPLSFINPDDIESITVLKDATSTSIYGADGANGVILVTTKRGHEGRLTIQAAVQYGVSNIDDSTAPKVLNAAQWMELAKSAYKNAGLDMRIFPFQDNDMNRYSATDTNWRDIYYGTGHNFNANVSLKGGSQRTDYFLSGQYYKKKSTVKGNDQQRFTLNSNLGFQLTKNLKVSVDLSASYNDNDLFALGREYYQLLPIYSPYNADGTIRLYNKVVTGIDDNGNLIYSTQRFITNSVAEREQNTNNQKAWFLKGNFKLKYDILKGLSYTGQFSYDYQSTLEQIYNSQKNWTGMSKEGNPLGYSRRSSADYTNWATIHRFNFNQVFGKHHIGGVLGFEAKSNASVTMYVTGQGFINDKVQNVSYANTRDGYNSSSKANKVSFLGQASYSYDQRYYLTVNARKDGNSQFGTDVRWANFASMGVSWNMHNEKWFRIPWLNVLKLKASYGSNGNSRLGSQESLGTYQYGESFSYNGEMGGVQGQSPNSKLSWETTYMTNLGIRLAVLNRIDFEFEYYHNKTKNLLSQLPVSLLTGDTRVYRNIGELLNQGVEFTLTTYNIKPKRENGFSWKTEVNLSHNSNKLTKSYRGTQVNFSDGISWIEGEDTKTYYLVRWAGVDPYDGSPMWYDAKGNITKNYDSVNNRVRGKSMNPTITGGMTNSFTYKSISLRFQLAYQFGGYINSSFASLMNSDGYRILSENQAIEQLLRWQRPGDIARNPKAIAKTSTNSSRSSTRFLYKKDIVRLQNVVLNYQLPRNIVKGWGLSDASVSLIGDNLLAYSPYSGKNHNSYKTLMSGYPLERTFSIAFNVAF